MYAKGRCETKCTSGRCLIRQYFSEIVEGVIDRKALLRVAPNKEGHPEFNAVILDEAGKATRADDGHTYRKLLCAAFDMALLRAHLAEKAPRFLYHDEIFESLDDRKKLNLVAVMRHYTDLGIQFVVTLIDSDLPETDPVEPVFTDEEIVLRLHDEGPEGRLFRMKSWRRNLRASGKRRLRAASTKSSCGPSGMQQLRNDAWCAAPLWASRSVPVGQSDAGCGAEFRRATSTMRRA